HTIQQYHNDTEKNGDLYDTGGDEHHEIHPGLEAAVLFGNVFKFLFKAVFGTGNLNIRIAEDHFLCAGKELDHIIASFLSGIFYLIFYFAVKEAHYRGQHGYQQQEQVPVPYTYDHSCECKYHYLVDDND